jgi:hypothetical protein
MGEWVVSGGVLSEHFTSATRWVERRHLATFGPDCSSYRLNRPPTNREYRDYQPLSGRTTGHAARSFRPCGGDSASKFALEGMAESLRLEVRTFGIRVVIIERGDTKTEITHNRKDAEAATSQQVYHSFSAARKRTASDEQNGTGPEGVSRLLGRIVNTPNPRLRHTIGPPAQRAAVWMKRLLPNAVLEYGMRTYYRLGG